MTGPIHISQQTARRFILGKQGLWPGRRFAGKEGTREAILACEHLQLDPLVIVARSHDLMLHSRVAGYRPAFFAELTYAERRFFDWGGWLAVRPMHELPYWRVLMRRNRERMRYVTDHHPEAVEEMRAVLRERPTVSARDVQGGGRKSIDSYRGSTDSSLALYYLWRTGEAMTHHRDGFERIYATAETVAPAHLLAEADEKEADLFFVLKTIAFAGIASAGRVSPNMGRDLARKFSKAEEQKMEQELLDRGLIASVEVEGWRGRHTVLAKDLDLLADVAADRVPAAWQPLGPTTADEVTLLSPLDPVSARGRAKHLFDFDYLWEIYKRAEDVQYGRFTMPILWDDRLAGRLDPRLDRKTNTLIVNDVWLEGGAKPSPEFLEALAAGVAHLMTFLAAQRVDATTVRDPKIRKRITALNPRRRATRTAPAVGAAEPQPSERSRRVPPPSVQGPQDSGPRTQD